MGVSSVSSILSSAGSMRRGCIKSLAFPRDQTVLLRSDLRDDHASTLARIAAFVGIGVFPDTGLKREFVRATEFARSEPSMADRVLIAKHVGADLQAFARLTTIDVTGWPTYRAITS
ncbi:MAG: hypothetical protein INR68_19475 [Methylobacterium mesophilicum]|nr:hypothetical protein [Methylobacterium mesophilicum]